VADVDWEHVVEEISDTELRDRREVRSRPIVLIMHLLKWQFQPELQDRSTWRSTIVEQRSQLQFGDRRLPSLGRVPREELPRLYGTAAKRPSAETGLGANRFPQSCPYTAEQILDEDFFPSTS
jgi:hypothetical protein